MNNTAPQQIVLSASRHALIVMLICYLPHFFTAPWWLFLLVLAAIVYRLIADYFALHLLSAWIRIGLVIGCLFLLKMQYGSIISSGFFVGFLLTFIALKCVEIHSLRDLKVMVFCNFYLIFSALIVIQELWIVVYLLVAILANLSLMLKLNASAASLKDIGGKSGRLLLIAIPISIVLFYIFPRISNPLWQVPSLTESHIGFSERMSFGSISRLFRDDSTAMRITFAKNPIFNGYWRGLVLSFYNGVSWSGSLNSQYLSTLTELADTDPGDYEVVLEPHQKKWLFYTDQPVAGRPNLLFSDNAGLASQDNDIITQRFAYVLKVEKPNYRALNPMEMKLNTQLPKYANPRLAAWAKEQYAKVHQDPQAFVRLIRNYIHTQPYWYTLSPPSLGNANQMDAFWFDTRKGFCEYYASALTIILRDVGIPARVIVGYQGGQWNPFARYLEIQQNDAHAWLEYWQEGRGWQLLDPTSFIATERIDQTIQDMESYRANQDDVNTAKLSLIQRLKLFIQSSRFFAERWFLFYNQDSQRELLSHVGFSQTNLGQLLQLVIISIIIFFIGFGFISHWWQKRSRDPLLIEYHLLQKQFRRFNVPIHSSATIKQQCQMLINKAPTLAPLLTQFVHHYEQLRLRQPQLSSKENNKKTLLLFRTLRKKLANNSPAKLR